MDKRKPALSKLEALDIPYAITEHEAVYTIEEMDALGITAEGEVCKNLFLRDAKGRTHYLVVIPGAKSANLGSIAEQLGSTKLSFASEQRLDKYLKLTKGEVTPLAAVNDEDDEVIVAFEKSLRGLAKVGVHPNDNTATVWLSFADLERYVRACGNEVRFVSL